MNCHWQKERIKNNWHLYLFEFRTEILLFQTSMNERGNSVSLLLAEYKIFLKTQQRDAIMNERIG